MTLGADDRGRGISGVPFRILLTVLLIVSIWNNGWPQSKVSAETSDLGQSPSLGKALTNAEQHPVHILYIHGIGARKATDSWVFQKHICTLLNGCKVPKDLISLGRDYVDRGTFAEDAAPPALKYMGNLVWATKKDWRASAPFVDHYVLRRGDGGPIVVDEINWWPLVFPLKCRQIMAGEAQLAGPDKQILDVCSPSEEKQDPQYQQRFIAYQWIVPDDAKKLKSMRAQGALVNRDLKTSLLDWGFGDAMMAVGSMRDLFREAMRQLFVKSAQFNPDGSKTYDWKKQLEENGSDRQFIVVSHSLGSYLVFSTLEDREITEQRSTVSNDLSTQGVTGGQAASGAEDNAAPYILERTSVMYFFANQVPLLELATMEQSRPRELAQPAEALSGQMLKWKALRQKFGERHVVAFSDPSDLLSWRVPEIKGLKIENCYVRNTLWHWVVASPSAAHINYAQNKVVLRIMLDPKMSIGHSCESSQ